MMCSQQIIAEKKKKKKNMLQNDFFDPNMLKTLVPFILLNKKIESVSDLCKRDTKKDGIPTYEI